MSSSKPGRALQAFRGTGWHPPLLRWVWVCTHGSAKMKPQRVWNREHSRALSGHCVTGQTRAGLGLSPSLQGHLCSIPQLWREQTQFMLLPLWHDLAASVLRWMRIADSDCRDHYSGRNSKQGIQDHPNPAFNEKGETGKAIISLATSSGWGSCAGAVLQALATLVWRSLPAAGLLWNFQGNTGERGLKSHNHCSRTSQNKIILTRTS